MSIKNYTSSKEEADREWYRHVYWRYLEIRFGRHELRFIIVQVKGITND